MRGVSKVKSREKALVQPKNDMICMINGIWYMVWLIVVCFDCNVWLTRQDMWCLLCDLSTWWLIVVFSVVLCCLQNPDMVDCSGLKRLTCLYPYRNVVCCGRSRVCHHRSLTIVTAITAVGGG
jgi:hypothetical protein